MSYFKIITIRKYFLILLIKNNQIRFISGSTNCLRKTDLKFHWNCYLFTFNGRQIRRTQLNLNGKTRQSNLSIKKKHRNHLVKSYELTHIKHNYIPIFFIYFSI